MFLDKEYFDGWMQRLSERLERIEKLCAGDVEQPLSILPDGGASSGQLRPEPYAQYQQAHTPALPHLGRAALRDDSSQAPPRGKAGLPRFIERNFSNFRKLKKDRPAGSG